MTPDEELRHLRHGPTPGESSGNGVLVTYTFSAEDPTVVLDRARQVLTTVVEQAVRLGDEAVWPPEHDWRSQLPNWFVDSFGPEPSVSPSSSGRSRWRRRPERHDEPSRAEGWTLESWLSWFDPDERDWQWWQAEARPHEGHVVVEVDGWPYPDGALRWLLSSAGAPDIRAEDG